MEVLSLIRMFCYISRIHTAYIGVSYLHFRYHNFLMIYKGSHFTPFITIGSRENHLVTSTGTTVDWMASTAKLFTFFC